MGPEREELLAVGDGQIGERGAAPVVRYAGQRGRGERERRIACPDQIGEVARGDGRCHARGFFFVVAVVLVLSVFFVVSGAGGLGSSWTPLACPVTVTRSTLSPFSTTSMTLPREELSDGAIESCSLARCVKERAELRAISRYSLLLGVPAESGTCIQRAVSESPAIQFISGVAAESFFTDSFLEGSFFEVEEAGPNARASVSTSSG